MMVEGVNFKTARDISGKTIELRQNYASSPARLTLKQIELPTITWQNAAADFVERSHQALLKNEPVLSWLKSERLIKLDTVKCFKLGWNASTTYANRQVWGLPEKINPETGRPFKVWLPDGLVIPLHDIVGRFVGIKIRRKPKEPPFAFVSGGSEVPAMFSQAIQTIQPAPAFIVVESELDAILLWQKAGDFITPISTGGVSMRPDKTTVEKMAAGPVSLLSFDSDDAGKEKKNLLPWKEVLKNFYLHPIPPRFGKDHTEAARSGMNLRTWLKAGLADISKSQAPAYVPKIELQPHGEAQNPSVDSEPASAKTIVTTGTAEEIGLIVRAIELAEISGPADRKAIDNSLNTINACQAEGDHAGYQFALSVLAANIEDAETTIQKSLLQSNIAA